MNLPIVLEQPLVFESLIVGLVGVTVEIRSSIDRAFVFGFGLIMLACGGLAIGSRLVCGFSR